MHLSHPQGPPFEAPTRALNVPGPGVLTPQAALSTRHRDNAPLRTGLHLRTREASIVMTLMPATCSQLDGSGSSTRELSHRPHLPAPQWEGNRITNVSFGTCKVTYSTPVSMLMKEIVSPVLIVYRAHCVDSATHAIQAEARADVGDDAGAEIDVYLRL